MDRGGEGGMKMRGGIEKERRRGGEEEERRIYIEKDTFMNV